GEFEQTVGTLHRTVQGDWKTDKPGLCCLGVLCELAAKEGHVQKRETDNGYLYDGEADELPPSVMDWAGLTEANPEVEYEMTPEEFEAAEFDPSYDSAFRWSSLAELNDSFRFDFKRIAGVIRANMLEGGV